MDKQAGSSARSAVRHAPGPFYNVAVQATELMAERDALRAENVTMRATLAKIGSGQVMTGEFTHAQTVEAYQRLARQHHQPSCPGCELCMSGTNKPDRSYPNAPDLDCVGRALRPGT